MKKFLGTFVRIEDCTGLAIDLSRDGNEKTIPIVTTLRDEAFRYGEWLFDSALLDRVIDPPVEPDEESF